MKWTPDTHNITFEIEDDAVVSFSSEEEKYSGRSVSEVYQEVLLEHQKINGAGLKDELESGELTIEEII